MHKFKRIIEENLILKITSLSSAVIGVRLIISLFIQRILAQLIGEAGIYKVGQLRSSIQMLASIGTLGTFNGIVKYVSEFKESHEELKNIFSSTFIITFFGSLVSVILLLTFSEEASYYLFKSYDYSYFIKILSVIIPFIVIQRIFYGIINGLSDYKTYNKIELLSYLISSILTIWFVIEFNLKGVFYSILLAPLIQLIVIFFSLTKKIKNVLKQFEFRSNFSYREKLMAFTLMSFTSVVLLNFVEIDIRSSLANKLSQNDAGIWTAMTFISKNYMVFSSALFTLYVIPRYARIHSFLDFKKELLEIYKTILPLFGIGMILIFLFRKSVIYIVYPGFEELEPLFKWQLLGDFVRLISLVLAHQFIAKKMVKSFIFTEILSLALFYSLSKYFVTFLGVEGVVLAHFLRYIIYLFVVALLVKRYFGRLSYSG